MQHHVDGFISWSQHWLQDIFVSHSTKALKSLFFVDILEAQLICFIVYAFFLLGGCLIRPLLYANKKTIASSIRQHPHTWKYSNTCFCCCQEPSTRHSDGSQSKAWAASLTHSPTLRRRKSRLELWWEHGAMVLWHRQDEDCRVSVWGSQGLVDRLHGGRGV